MSDLPSGLRVLVTGGYGFVGLHACRALSAAGAEFAVLDALTRAAVNADAVRALPGFLGEASGTAEGIPAWAAAAALLPRPDLLLHLAAESHVDASVSSPVHALEANAVGTARAAGHALALGAALVYCSTDEVYGDLHGTPWAQTGADEHRTPLRPSSPYSAGKAAGELAVSAYRRTYGLRAVVTRGSNAFGPGQVREKLLPIACSAVQRGGRVPLHGGGVSVRQWIHVEEFADGLLRAGRFVLSGPHRGVPTFNLAGPRALSVRDIVAAVARAAGRDPDSACYAAADRPGQDLLYAVDGFNAEAHLGLRPRRAVDSPAELAALLAAYPAGEERTADYGAPSPPAG